MGDMNNNDNNIIYSIVAPDKKDLMPHILSFEIKSQHFTV
jgi:hypothetical protein